MAILYRSAILRSEEGGDGGSGGGGGGGGAGGGSNDTPKFMTSEEVTAMVTGAVERNRKATLGEVSKLFDGFKSGLPDLLAPLIKSAVPQPAEPAGGEPKPDPRLAVFESKLQETTKLLESERTARIAAEGKARDDKAFNDLRAALGPHVRPEALDQAARLLFFADKRVTFDDDGRPQLTVRRTINGLDEDAQMPLADGALFWAKSKEGAIFAPAPAGGAPDPKRGTPGRQTSTRNGIPVYDKPATSEEEKLRRSMEREAALESNFKNLT